MFPQLVGYSHKGQSMNLLMRGVLSFISSAADWHASLSRGLAVPAIHFLCFKDHSLKGLVRILPEIESYRIFPLFLVLIHFVFEMPLTDGLEREASDVTYCRDLLEWRPYEKVYDASVGGSFLQLLGPQLVVIKSCIGQINDAVSQENLMHKGRSVLVINKVTSVIKRVITAGNYQGWHLTGVCNKLCLRVYSQGFAEGRYRIPLLPPLNVELKCPPVRLIPSREQICIPAVGCIGYTSCQ